MRIPLSRGWFIKCEHVFLCTIPYEFDAVSFHASGGISSLKQGKGFFPSLARRRRNQ